MKFEKKYNSYNKIKENYYGKPEHRSESELQQSHR